MTASHVGPLALVLALAGCSSDQAPPPLVGVPATEMADPARGTK